MAVGNTELNEYWALLAEIERQATTDVKELLDTLESLDEAERARVLTMGIEDIVATYRPLSAQTATLFYEETQNLAFSSADLASASAVNNQQLSANLRWALATGEPEKLIGRISGIVQKHVMNGSRHYAMSGFNRTGGGWFRAARPGACAFCRMLATRAATEWGPYGSASAAIFIGEGDNSRKKAPPETKYHDDCYCQPVLASQYEIPDHVAEWTEDYYKATQTVGNSFDMKSILTEMRKLSPHKH